MPVNITYWKNLTVIEGLLKERFVTGASSLNGLKWYNFCKMKKYELPWALLPSLYC